jgi:hypothetical protein
VVSEGDVHGAPGSEVKPPVKVIEQEPVAIVSSGVGERATIAIPLGEKLWARRRYEARFEPKQAGLSLSANKGWCEAGTSEMPFNVIFEPTNKKKIETTLIVSFGDFETRTHVSASVGGRLPHRRE